MMKPVHESALGQSFEQRVRKAIEDFDASYRHKFEKSEPLPVKSIASFSKSFLISRAHLYQDFPHLVEEIKQLFAGLDQLKPPLVVKRKSLSATVLEKEIVRLKREHKEAIAIAISKSLNSFLEQCGPAFREKSQLLLEKQELMRQIETLRKQLYNQSAIISNLMAQVNR